MGNVVMTEPRSQIGKLFLTPSESVYIFRNKPVDGLFQTALYRGKYTDLVNQYVIVVDTNNSHTPGDLYYKAMFKDGQIYWIHCFDLIQVDQKTGEPIISNFDNDI
jgi:hypothetical protein